MRLSALLSAAAILTLGALGALPGNATTGTAATQSVTTGELQRYIYQANYPTWCSAAGDAARHMRANPTTDPARLHAVMNANIDQCANQPAGQRSAPLWNTAVFGAAAAALLAARHEPLPASLRDAKYAQKWSAMIADYQHQPGATSGPGSYNPSMYRTNAGRINRDAVALIAALQAPAAPSPAASP